MGVALRRVAAEGVFSGLVCQAKGTRWSHLVACKPLSLTQDLQFIPKPPVPFESGFRQGWGVRRGFPISSVSIFCLYTCKTALSPSLSFGFWCEILDLRNFYTCEVQTHFHVLQKFPDNSPESCPAPATREGQVCWRPNKASSQCGFHWNLEKPCLASGLGPCSLLGCIVALSAHPSTLCEVGSLGMPRLTALALGFLPTFLNASCVSLGWSVNTSVPQCLCLFHFFDCVVFLCLGVLSCWD